MADSFTKGPQISLQLIQPDLQTSKLPYPKRDIRRRAKQRTASRLASAQPLPNLAFPWLSHLTAVKTSVCSLYFHAVYNTWEAGSSLAIGKSSCIASHSYISEKTTMKEKAMQNERKSLPISCLSAQTIRDVNTEPQRMRCTRFHQ